ncbi:MAG TPA: TlpA disulfide reductase family protein [Vicinamibacterales bacterium]|nr:TlpA disulfide reductase family protein [Vicinamibacterales bacterium]
MLAALLLAAVVVTTPGVSGLPESGPRGQRLPESLTLRDLDGREVRLADLDGRVVLLDVWATWCAPCLAELPTLRRLQAAYPRDLVVVGVSLDTMSRRDFVSWLRRQDVTWMQHFDGRGYGSPIAIRLGIDSLPASFLLAADGRVAARDLRGAALERAVRNLVVDRRRP